MEPDLKAIDAMIMPMASARLSIWMEVDTLENERTTEPTERESMSTKQESGMKEIGGMIFSMAKERKIGWMGVDMSAIIATARNAEKGSMNGTMEPSIKANELPIKYKVAAFTPLMMAGNTKANG